MAKTEAKRRLMGAASKVVLAAGGLMLLAYLAWVLDEAESFRLASESVGLPGWTFLWIKVLWIMAALGLVVARLRNVEDTGFP